MKGKRWELGVDGWIIQVSWRKQTILKELREDLERSAHEKTAVIHMGKSVPVVTDTASLDSTTVLSRSYSMGEGAQPAHSLERAHASNLKPLRWSNFSGIQTICMCWEICEHTNPNVLETWIAVKGEGLRTNSTVEKNQTREMESSRGRVRQQL